jgi:hypothetical protein
MKPALKLCHEKCRVDPSNNAGHQRRFVLAKWSRPRLIGTFASMVQVSNGYRRGVLLLFLTLGFIYHTY